MGPQGRTVWVWRSGQTEQRDEWALSNGFAGGGWDWMPSMVGLTDKEAVRASYLAHRPPEAAKGETPHVRQLWNIRTAVNTGDVIVMPRNRRGCVAFGTVISGYEYLNSEIDPTKRHVVRVDWVLPNVPRSQLDPDLSEGLKSQGTIYRPQQNEAQERLLRFFDSHSGHATDVSTGPEGHHRAFLLTWDPTQVSDSSEWHSSNRWSTRSRRPQIGDRVYLFRQKSNRGISRSGTVIRTASEDLHWDQERAQRGDTSLYLGIEWDDALEPDPRLPIHLLKNLVPEVHWDFQRASGNQLPEGAALRLGELWDRGNRKLPLADAAWDIAPGAIVTRADIKNKYGGALYGGIQPSAQTPNVFLYSDPESSGEIYPYDGWSSDRTVFLYTGEGKIGDQKLTKGNRAIARHGHDGKTLRLFSATGYLEGTSTRTHVYLGAFQVDPENPFVRQSAPDDNDEERSVLVFRLRPLGATMYREEDASSTDDVAPGSRAELINAEANNAREFPIQPGKASVGTRNESDLVDRFMAWHPSGRHAFKRWKVRPKGELKDLFTDIFDTKTRTLYEAKGHATRNAVREAIGQLLDYRRHIDPSPASICVLLPERPTDDLVSLITSLGMSCVFETESGAFTRVDSSPVSTGARNGTARPEERDT